MFTARRRSTSSIIPKYPTSFFGSGESGMLFDANIITSLYKDTTAINPVTTNGDTVAYMADLSGNGYHANQATGSKTYLYDSNGFVAADDLDDVLVATIPSLGSDATVATSYNGEILLETGQTVGAGSYNLPTSNFRAHLAIDRELSYTEINRLISKWSKDFKGKYGAIKSRIDLIMLNANDVKVYDTTKDSDGGAWRTSALALDSSWYSETLNTVIRGSRAEFPKIAIIVSEATKVIIYDGDDPSLPMWMTFPSTGVMSYGSTLNSVSMSQAWLQVSADNGQFLIHFLTGEIGFLQTSNYRSSTIATRDTTALSTTSNPFSGYINSVPVKMVDMIVLDNAPIDGITGIATPTIALATEQGISVITNDNNIWDLMTAQGTMSAVSYDQNGGLWITGGETYSFASYYFAGQPIADSNVPTFTFDATSIPPRIGTNLDTGEVTDIATGLLETIFVKNNTAPMGLIKLSLDRAMTATISSEYNTGWMPGDIKGTWLSSIATTFDNGSPAATARADLIANNGWVISDGGLA